MNSPLDLNRVLQVLKDVLSNKGASGLHEPQFNGNEWEYVKECLDTGWVSSVGRFVELFEAKLEEYTGVKYAVATVNGTAALHICLKLAGVEPGDEVFVPALTFVATANAVTYCGAVPHFVDIDINTLGIDSHKLADYLKENARVGPQGCFNMITGRRIKAVIPMHTFGHPVDIDPLMEICEKFRLEMIEDAAEALGSLYKGRHAGNFGIASALSFNGNKIITTGGGGAILTNQKPLALLAKHLTTTAKKPHQWFFVHDMVGYNYRLPNINAALGCAQIEQLPDFLNTKRMLASKYLTSFKCVDGITVFEEPPYARSNYWLNTLILDEGHENQLDKLIEMSNEMGISTRPVWRLLSRLQMFSSCPRMNLVTAESLEGRIINLPSSATLGEGYEKT
ncbi:MAG: aminotransferase DegT [Firmicutes bacterium HGW-Firmicutes-14]|jgi:perosamine synthetase|nr:MAG: aminotransferase DegT [Firmicutes bacterium HGW-Firmicutes-14]